MSEKTKRQIEEMKKQTIGVQVEMNNITREKAARVAANLFGTGRYKNTASRNGYQTWSAWDSDNREWKFSKDVSISASIDTRKAEVVSPILRYNDLEALQEIAVVIDAFGGSGSTLIKCEQMNRICYMMELDKKFAYIILQRYVEDDVGVYVICNGQQIPYFNMVKEVERQKSFNMFPLDLRNS